MVDLPTIPDRVPTVRAPESKVSAGQIASPYVDLANTLELASRETGDLSKRLAKEAGLKAVTRDDEGNVQVERPPIVGPAAIEYRDAVKVAAVADGENVIKTDLLDLRHKLKDDPEGFRKAAETYGKQKVGQYEKAAGTEVGLALGRIANSTAREFHEGLLNHKEALDLQRATASIQVQIESTKNELFALAAGGDTTSPGYIERLQKIGALWGQLANNPRLAIPKERAAFEIDHLNGELALANLGFRVAKVQAEQGTDAALREADKVRTDPGLALKPAERFTTYSRLVQGIQQRAIGEERGERRVIADIDRHVDSAAKGYPPSPAEIGTLRQVVEQSKNPALTARLNELEIIAPIVADWRKASPAQLERNLADLERTMAEGGKTPAMEKLHTAGSLLLKNMREGLKNDPLGWGTRTGGAPVTPIDWAKPDLDAQLRNRTVEAEANTRKYGLTPTYLLPDERAVLQAATAKGGDAMTSVAVALVSGFGDRAPFVLREISKDSPVLAHIGGLMTSNGSPALIRDAAEAVQLRADPEVAKNLPNYLTNEPGKMLAAQHTRTVDVYGGAFSRVPDTGRAAEATAQSAFFTRAWRNGYDPSFIEGDTSTAKTVYDRTLQEAAGATFSPSGTQYGGVASYGTKPGTWFKSGKVLIPGNIRNDRFGDVVGALTDADIQLPSSLAAATADMKLSPQETALYERHLKNLVGPGGVTNADRSRSTLFAITAGIGDKTYILPTVHDGKILQPEAAIARAREIGLDRFPSYGSQEEAQARYEKLHGFMERDTQQYLRSPPPIAADGKPYSVKDIKNATPVAVQGGYRFAAGDPMSDNPKWIRGADGKPFVLDLEKLEPALRKRVPDAYAGQ